MNKLGTKFGDDINKPTLMLFSKLLLIFRTHNHPSQKNRYCAQSSQMNKYSTHPMYINA
jgi:hypothetical protein